MADVGTMSTNHLSKPGSRGAVLPPLCHSLRQFYASLIGRRDQFHDRTLALPGHRRGKPIITGRVEQGAVSVVFQDAPQRSIGLSLL